MARPLLLDLFCGAGGCSVGYARAGFEVVGIDNAAQPRYPYRFVQADALRVLRERPDWILKYFDAVHASPPCHHYSTGTKHRKNAGIQYPDLLPETQHLLRMLGLPYVIENVPGARSLLRDPIMLCGGMFNLGVKRHRLFECSTAIPTPVHTCNGDRIDADMVSVTRHGPPARWYRQNPGATFDIRRWHDAMGIDWMDRTRLTQAIPPAYTEYIGRQLYGRL